jgi:hypothetical protein
MAYPITNGEIAQPSIPIEDSTAFANASSLESRQPIISGILLGVSFLFVSYETCTSSMAACMVGCHS